MHFTNAYTVQYLVNLDIPWLGFVFVLKRSKANIYIINHSVFTFNIFSLVKNSCYSFKQLGRYSHCGQLDLASARISEQFARLFQT